jgi:response regulator RpfG family c-di-GMP phosphodiesterase
MIPIIIITAEQDAKYKDHCENLGAVGYFEKPLDFDGLKRTLTARIAAKRTQRRAHVRVRMRLALKLGWDDASGRKFEEMTTTENVSAAGFLCNCMAAMAKDTIVKVTLRGGSERYPGQAPVVREESSSTPWHRYGFKLLQKMQNWPFQALTHGDG